MFVYESQKLYTQCLEIYLVFLYFYIDEIVHLFKYTRPSMVFVDSDNIDKIEKALTEVNLSNVPIYVFGDSKNYRNIEELFIETENVPEMEFKPPNIGDPTKQPAVIICSSGTTGLSKGVALANSTVLKNTFAT